jgi:hypothetical protein
LPNIAESAKEKRIRLCLAILALLAIISAVPNDESKAPMPISFISSNGAGARSGPVTVPIAISAHDTVIIVVATDATTSINTPTDTGGTAYTLIGSTSNGALGLNLYASPPSGALASTSVTCSVVILNTDVVAIVARYSGVAGFGNSTLNGNTTANPSVVLGTSIAASFAVGAFINNSGSVDTANTGNLRQSIFFSGVAKDTASLADNTASSGFFITNAVTKAASTWASFGLELLGALPTEDSWAPPLPSPVDSNVTIW